MNAQNAWYKSNMAGGVSAQHLMDQENYADHLAVAAASDPFIGGL